MPKYAVKVPFITDEDNDWLFITKDGPDGLEIVLYDTYEKAVTQASRWGRKAEIVEYNQDDFKE